MEKLYYIQLSGEMILANGAFENGLFKTGKIENNNNWSERLKPRKLALYETYGKISDDKNYHYLDGTHQAPVTAKGPFKTGFYINGEKSNIGNYNSDTKYVFKPIDAEEEGYFRYYEEFLVDEIGQQYNIETPGGTYTHTVSSPDVLRLLTPDKIANYLLHEFDVYSVKWPIYGTVLNALTLNEGVSSFRSDAEGSYYTTFEPNVNNQRQPILVTVSDYSGMMTISTIEGNGIKIGEFESNEGGGTFAYSSVDTIVYSDMYFNYYPYYHESFTFGPPDNNATIKRVSINGMGPLGPVADNHIWDNVTMQWNVFQNNNSGGGSGGSGGSGSGSGGDNGNNPFVVNIESMTFNLGNGNGGYLEDGTVLSTNNYVNDSNVSVTESYVKSQYTEFSYELMEWIPVHTVGKNGVDSTYGNVLYSYKWFFDRQVWDYA